MHVRRVGVEGGGARAVSECCPGAVFGSAACVMYALYSVKTPPSLLLL